MSDTIGNRGQWIFSLLVSRICPGQAAAYFDPGFLGDKYPTFDFLVHLAGSDGFFLAQVKTTRQGYREGKGERRLRVNVSLGDIQRLAASPAPTYVVGIDEIQQAGYILSTNGAREAGLGGIPTRHPLDCDNLARLWQEVHRYWVDRPKVMPTSYFV